MLKLLMFVRKTKKQTQQKRFVSGLEQREIVKLTEKEFLYFPNEHDGKNFYSKKANLKLL